MTSRRLRHLAACIFSCLSAMPSFASAPSVATVPSHILSDGTDAAVALSSVPGGVCLSRQGCRFYVSTAEALFIALVSPAAARVAVWRPSNASDASYSYAERRPVTLVRTHERGLTLVDPRALSNGDPYLAVFTADGVDASEGIARAQITGIGASMTIHRNQPLAAPAGDAARSPRASAVDDASAALAVAV
jgi:hypothetical protein